MSVTTMNARSGSFNAHPLRFRFDYGPNVVDVFRSPKFLHLAAAQGLYRRTIIEEHRLRFSELVIPIFEDAHFTAKYLCLAKRQTVAFLPGAHYFYTKRRDQSSLLASAWNKPSRYDDLLRHGYLDILSFAHGKFGFVPRYVQNLVLYDLSWLLLRLVNHDHQVRRLGPARTERFVDLLKQISKWIDSQAVVEYDLTEMPDYCKCGLVESIMGRQCFDAWISVESCNVQQARTRLSCCFTRDTKVSIFVNGVSTNPDSDKTQTHTFAGQFFAFERHLDVRTPRGSHFRVLLDEKPALIRLGQSRLKQVSTEQMEAESQLQAIRARTGFVPWWVEPLRSLASRPRVKRRFEGVWLLMDRDIQADDNAEHLYRHILRTHPKIRAYFVLRRSSHDWNRLKREGFRLIAFGSLSHKLAFLNCRVLASSHVDGYIVNFLPKKWFPGMAWHKFVFLQHGVTQGDISNWINQKPIDCIIAAGRPEWEAFTAERGRYRHSTHEVRLTGLPRFDQLLSDRRSTTKTLLVMPTWREYVVGTVQGKSNRRTLREGFEMTRYAQSWRWLLNSEQLHSLARQYGYRIVFFPHANIAPYQSQFNLNPAVVMRTHEQGSVQEALASATVLITDYSSVAFDMAFLQRAVLYFQFDRGDFYSGEHLYAQGYFDHERDGFGPCCSNDTDLLGALEQLLRNSGFPEPQYLERMERFFPYRDNKNCERVLGVIFELLANAHML